MHADQIDVHISVDIFIYSVDLFTCSNAQQNKSTHTIKSSSEMQDTKLLKLIYYVISDLFDVCVCECMYCVMSHVCLPINNMRCFSLVLLSVVR